MSDRQSQLPNKCPECGMPIKRGRTTGIDDTGKEYDAGGYVYWMCAGIMGSGPGSPACQRITELKYIVARAKAAAERDDYGAVLSVLGLANV